MSVKSLLTGTLSSMALYPGSLMGQALVLNQERNKALKPQKAVKPVKVNNSHIRYIKDTVQPYFVIQAYYCAAHNTAEERKLMEASIAFWNKQSGKYGYKVSKGEDSEVLPVYFELSEAPGYYSGEGFFVPAGRIHPNLLTYVEVIPDEKLQALYQKNPNEVSVGFTTHHAIYVSDKYADKMSIGMHEMGHSLGASHCRHGIMDPDLLFVKPRVKKGTIRNILKEAGIPVKGAKVSQAKRAIRRHNLSLGKGKVVKNKQGISRQLYVYNN